MRGFSDTGRAWLKRGKLFFDDYDDTDSDDDTDTDDDNDVGSGRRQHGLERKVVDSRFCAVVLGIGWGRV